MATALHLWETGIIRITRHPFLNGMSLWALQDGAGLVSYAENRSGALSFCVGLDHAGSTNVVPSRGAPLTSDTLARLPLLLF